MGRSKTKRNAALIALAPDYTQSELGDIFGVSRERARQILEAEGVTATKTKHDHRILDKVRDLLGTMTDAKLARTLKVSPNVVRNYRRNLGIPKFEAPIGCPDCKTNPYARGLCRPCYDRDMRRAKKEAAEEDMAEWFPWYELE